MPPLIPTFEESGLRYEFDRPVAIPSLKRALQLLAREGPDPHRLRMLIFFFSSLIRHVFRLPFQSDNSADEQARDITDDLAMRYWKSDKANLENLKSFWYRDLRTLFRVHAVIEQLDPIATFREVNRLAKINIHGPPGTSLNQENGWKGKFTMMNRGYDWLIRCAFKLEIPNMWKKWLQVMYQKQPCQVYDEDYQHEYQGALAFEMSVIKAGRSRQRWSENIIPLTAFWLRQALTIVNVWNTRLAVDAHRIDDGDDAMPPYSWCVAAYEKMRDHFLNDMEHPFSAYPYDLRLRVLRKLDYMTVFEDCWGLVHEACSTAEANSFNFFQVRRDVHNAIVQKVRNVLRRQIPGNVIDDLDLAFENTFERPNEQGKYWLLIEGPQIEPYALQYDLQEWRALHNGMCDQWYPLPLFEEEESDDFSDIAGLEFELPEDVEFEVYGPRINIAEFTVSKKESDADAFCTWCQDMVSSADSGAKRCVVPMACSDTFHAECLDIWVNGASRSSNLCPNCKVRMTPMQRARRPILTGQ